MSGIDSSDDWRKVDLSTIFTRRELFIGGGALLALAAEGTPAVSQGAAQPAQPRGGSAGPQLVIKTGHAVQSAITGVFTPDGKTALTIGQDYSACLWEASTGRQVRNFTGHTGVVNSAVFYAGGAEIITASDDGTVRFWDTSTGETKRVLKTQGSGNAADRLKLCTAVPSSDGKYLLVSTRYVRDSESTQAVHSITDTELIGIWETARLTPLWSNPGRNDSMCSAVFSTDNRTVLSVGGRGNVVKHDVLTGAVLARYTGVSITNVTPNIVRSAVFSPDEHSSMILTASLDGTARIWDSNTGAELQRLEVSRVFPEGNGIYSPDFIRRTFLAGNSLVTHIAFSADGKYVRTTTRRNLKQWEVSTGKASGITQGPWIAPEISHDGKYEVTADGLIDTLTGTPITKIEGGSTTISPAYCVLADTNLLILNSYNSEIWDLSGGLTIRKLGARQDRVRCCEFSSDAARVIVGSSSGATLWDVASGTQLGSFAGRTDLITSRFTEDGQHIVTLAANRPPVIWDIQTGDSAAPSNQTVIPAAGSAHLDCQQTWLTNSLRSTYTGGKLANFAGRTELLSAGNPVLRSSCIIPGQELTLAQDQTSAIVSGADTVTTITDDGTCNTWNVVTGRRVRSFTVHNGSSDTAHLFSQDARYLLAVGESAGLWEAETGRLVWRAEREDQIPLYAMFSKDSSLVALSTSTHGIAIHSTSSGKQISTTPAAGRLLKPIGFSSSGQFLIAAEVIFDPVSYHMSNPSEITLTRERMYVSGFASLNFIDTKTGAELCRLLKFRDGGWAAIDPHGRFDANRLEDLVGLSWVLPDSPLKPLGPEMFLKQYFTPRLLSKILSGAPLPSIPDIAGLNRVQPEVKVTTVTQPGDDPGTVEVSVQCASASADFVQGNRTTSITKQSGLTDLRLFRDGQLVGWLPDSGSADGPVEPGTHIFKVRLPNDARLKSVDFTAYAFNTSRVRSETSHHTYTMRSPLATRKGNAYLLAVGINVTDTPILQRLSFAARDATTLLQTLGDRLERGGQFEHVVRIALLSDDSIDKRGALATKANIKLALDILAGVRKPTDAISSIPGAGSLLKATPDDTVILSFAGHGDTDSQGNFYVFPAGMGVKPNARIEDLYAHAISDLELASWFRGVDAGDMAIVMDTCHSAGAIENGDFKPGPMGSKGLGQLAYEKGMLVLAASQAADEALETGRLKHGLLTYALTVEGLEQHLADWKPKDGAIYLDEWLEYGVKRVPALYREVLGNTLNRASTPGNRGPVFPDSSAANASSKRRYQQPALFNYKRGARRSVIDRIPSA